MKYEIVEIKKKIVVGYTARTSNTSKEMQSIIGGLWQKLYRPECVSSITDRVNEYAIGLYSDYEGEEYNVTAGFEVKKVPSENSEFTVKVIPGGKYAKFSLHGDMVEAVANAWGEIWQTPLERTYTGDFEEYTSMTDIDIYIAVK